MAAKPSNKQQPPRWWQSLPAVLTATVGVITALTGMIVALEKVGIIRGDRNATVASAVPEHRLDGREDGAIGTEPSAANRTITQLCQRLQGYAIDIDSNGYHGTIGLNGISLQPMGNDRFSFKTSIVFSPETDQEFSQDINDPIVGECKGSTITFTRKLWNDTRHTHSGVIFDDSAGTLLIRGSFMDEERRQYPWDGRIVNAVP